MKFCGVAGSHSLTPGAPGVRVHPREQAARHPFGVDRIGPCTCPAARTRSARAPRARPRRGRAQGGDVREIARRWRCPRSRGGRAATADDRVFLAGDGASASARASVVHHSSTSSCRSDLTAAARDELVPRLPPLVAGAGEHERAQEVVQVVGRRRLGLDLGVHLLDGFGFERADGREVDRQAAPQRDRVGAPVLELFVVEERVRAAR